MRVNENAYEWNHAVGPSGNLGGVDPCQVAYYCDLYGVPWSTSAWPYSSGVKMYCDDNTFRKIINQSKVKTQY